MDNPFVTETSGQADWDSGIEANWTAINRGYHITERAGTVINTGQVLWLNSGGFFMPFDPNSESIMPHAFAYTAAASGDSMTVLAYGIVRSLGVTSPAIPGKNIFVSPLTPGLVVSSYAASNRCVGFGLNGGILFNPQVGNRHLPERITSSAAYALVTGAAATGFTMSVGRYGWNRETVMIGNSATLVELKFWANSSHTKLLYQTLSGGVSVVGSFQDRAGWPWSNTDPTTLGDLVYGTIAILSGALVSSDTISVQQDWQRER